MDLILYNGTIYTQDKTKKAEAIAIKGECIHNLGSNEEILKLKTNKTALVDLKGSLAIPGFNDSHMHLSGTGLYLENINLSKTKSIKEIKEVVGEKAKTKKTGEIVFGRGWNQDNLAEKRLLNKTDLDEIATDKGIILYRVCGHIAVVNSYVLKQINPNLKIAGGNIDYEKGIFYENALELLSGLMPEITVETIKDNLRRGISHANKLDLTSVQSDDFGDYKKVLSAYQELKQAGELTLRVYEQSLLPDINSLKAFIHDGYKTGVGDDYFKIGPLKLLLDGSLGAHTAALSIPYNDKPETKGILTYTDDVLNEIITYAAKHGMQIAIHGIGDRAIKQALDQIAKLDYQGARHSIIHLQITDEEIIARLKALHTLALVQPIFLDYDHKIVEKRVGTKLASTSYRLKTLLDKGIKIGLGTDSPVETLDPIKNLYLATSGKDLDGNPIYNPNEVISLEEAVFNYTYGSSYASFTEEYKGLLKPGYLADITVLDKDIFNIDKNDLLHTKVRYTIVGGQIVYQK